MLYEKAYKRILEEIIKGRLKPGTLLREEHLSIWLGMSRTPIREALARLERDGLVVKRGRSYAVAVLGGKDMEELYEVRIPLEVAAAKLAALRAPAQALDKLKKVFNDMWEECNKRYPDPFKLVELGGNFHDVIAEATENKYLRDNLNSIRLRLTPVRLRLYLSESRRFQEIEEHKQILEAVSSRNQTDAEYYMELHESNVLKYLKGVIG